MKSKKYDISIDGYNIRNDADFNRVDMSKAERNKYYRKIKIGKRNWYKQIMDELLKEIEECRNL